jgi:16S rRNA processing protein RimM
MRWDEMITVGRIVRPQGNRGEVVVESETDFGDERFQPGAVLYAQRMGEIGETRVESSRPHAHRWVVGFAGVGTIDEAEALRGVELRIPAGQLRTLDAGQHYVHDLVGCEMQTTTGQVVGTVGDVRLDTGVPILVVAGARGEVLVPFTEAFCRSVDVAGKRIVIDPPDGLLDVNAPAARERS